MNVVIPFFLIINATFIGLTAREMAQKCNYKYKKLKDCAAVAKLLKEYGISEFI